MKGLALTVGGSVGIGLGIKMSRALTARTTGVADHNPVLARLGSLEDRLNRMECANVTLAEWPEQSRLLTSSFRRIEDRMKAEHTQIEELRAAIHRAGQEREERLDRLSQAVHGLEASVPELICRETDARFEGIHERLHRAIQDTASQTLDAFAARIHEKVGSRIASLEENLSRQSQDISALRAGARATSEGLQKLLARVEGFVEVIDDAAKSIEPKPVAAAPIENPVHEPAPAKAAAAAASAGYVSPLFAQVGVPRSRSVARERPLGIEATALNDLPPRPAAALKKPSGPVPIEFPPERPRKPGLRRAFAVGGGFLLTAILLGGVLLSGFARRSSGTHSAKGKDGVSVATFNHRGASASRN